MTGNWQNTFGGASVNPAQASYAALTIAVNTALVWSLESSQGTPVVAAELAVTATANSLSLAMPDATQGATGIATIIYNPGSRSFTLTNTLGAQIAVIAAGTAWVISLTDNTTAAGVWLPIQLGALTSNASAGALAGYGLQAISTQLQSSIATSYLNTNTGIDGTYRASGIVWQGTAVGALQLAAISVLTAGWWVLVTNLGTNDLVISTTGTDTINGVATITIPAGGSGAPYSTLIVASSVGFNTFAGTPPIIPITGGGTGADDAGEALVNLGGSALGIDIFEAPNAAAILALLGIGPSAFVEATIGGNQNLTLSSINTAFVCTAALQINLLATATVTKSFIIAVYAQGGLVTLSPGGSDAINGGAVGANYSIQKGESLLLTTDGAGNWWPFFLYPTLDSIGSTQGDILYRNATVWTVLAPSTIGQVLMTGGGAGNPSWASETQILDLIGNTQGDVLFRGASGWAALPPATSGQFLQTLGAAANPQWATPTPPQMHAQSFVASNTFTIPAGATANTVFKFRVIGGGGGGGCASGGSGTGGGGGGGGAYAEMLVSGFTAAQVVTVTVGAGGAGAAATGANGATGGSSKVTLSAVDFITAAGGVGGTSGTAGTQSGGAAGAVTSNVAGAGLSNPGTVATAVSSAGNIGGYAASSVASGGNGGSTPYGPGGGTTASLGAASTAGQAGAGYGGGGAGSCDGGTGGAGATGAVIVEWVL